MNDLTEPALRAHRTQRLASLILSAGLLAIGAPLSQAQHSASPPSTAKSSGFSGKVVGTTNAASYTYIQVDTGTKQLWVAAPQVTVE